MLKTISPSHALRASACRGFEELRKGFGEHELIARVLPEGKAHTSWLAFLVVSRFPLAGVLGHIKEWFFESESVC
jgi:hypothetical protein